MGKSFESRKMHRTNHTRPEQTRPKLDQARPDQTAADETNQSSAKWGPASNMWEIYQQHLCQAHKGGPQGGSQPTNQPTDQPTWKIAIIIFQFSFVCWLSGRNGVKRCEEGLLCQVLEWYSHSHSHAIRPAFRANRQSHSAVRTSRKGWGGGVYQSLGAVAPIICDFRATADSKIVGDRKRVWIYAQLNITSIR